MKEILMPISSEDFDPSEASIAWKVLKQNGISIRFSSEDGKPGNPDRRMMTGEGLGIWKKILMARNDAIDACKEMMESQEFRKPILHSDISEKDFHGIMLHGGHAPGIKRYLESEILQKKITDFMRAEKPIGAICHGVLLAARSLREDGRSILFGKRCTCLLKSQETAAHNMTRLWLGSYYRTYPETTTQAEVISFLRSREDFEEGPSPMFRDSMEKLHYGFTVQDGNILTARWPGDAYSYSLRYLSMLD